MSGRHNYDFELLSVAFAAVSGSKNCTRMPIMTILGLRIELLVVSLKHERAASIFLKVGLVDKYDPNITYLIN